MIINFKIFERDVRSNDSLTDEEKSELKFRIDDIVKIKNIIDSPILVIKKISTSNQFYQLFNYPYQHDDDCYGWRKGDYLEIVPEYKVSAIKYNL